MSKAREPDAELMSMTRAQVGTWRAAVESGNDERAKLDNLIIKLKETGHSYAQIREVTGFGTATIQMILAKAGVLPSQSTGNSRKGP